MNGQPQRMARWASWSLLVAMAGAGGWALAEMTRPENLLQFARALTLC